MRKYDYKNHFDKVKCSPEFRAKMEKVLSSEPDGEYADSVRDIEHAPKVNYQRWTALVVSFILVAGLGGAVFFNMRSSYNEFSYSDTSDSTEESEICSWIIESTDVRYSIELSMTELSMTGEYTNFGKLPDKLVNAIIEALESSELMEMTVDPSLDVDSTDSITLICTGRENFVCTINKNSNVVIEADNTEKYYMHDIYYDIIGIIAQYLPYCDWTSMVDGEAGTALDTAFKNHADEITINGMINGFMYPSDIKKVLGLKFFECGEFDAYIQENGDLNICYESIDSESNVIEYNRVYFSSSPELYEEIAGAVNAEEEYFASTNEELFTSIDTDIEGGQQLLYNDGNGEKSSVFDDNEMNILYGAVKSLEWSEGESGFPEGEYFSIGGNFITRDGIIYTSFNDKSFIAENQDISALISVFDDLKMLAEYRGFTDANEMLFRIVDENVKGNTNMGYMSSGGQDGTHVSFENINTENLCSAIKSLDWTAYDSGYPTGEFFIVGNMMITRDGKIYNTSGSALYSAENQDFSAINNALDEIVKSDDLSYMMYLIASSENKFSTMSGQITCFYEAYGIFGEGEFYYDNKKHDEYINIKDISGSASFAMKDGEWTFDRNYSEGTNFSEKGFRFYNTPLIEYKWLKSAILSHMKMTDTSELISFDVTAIEDSYNFCLNYINDDKQNIVVSVNIDSIGNPTEVTISEHFTDDDGNNLSNQEVIFSIGNGIGGGIVYDDPNFIIPQSSVNFVTRN